jgi:hypothetical protein
MRQSRYRAGRVASCGTLHQPRHMPAQFSDDPATPGARIWQRSGAGALGAGFAAVLLALITLGGLLTVGILFGTGMLHGATETMWGVILGLAFIVTMAALTLLCWRDMQGKRSASIRVSADGLSLHLRAGRSLIHHAPACDATIAWPDVSAIEMRLEAYRAQGMANMQRAYRLTRRSGAPIFLFEERALDTGLESESMHDIATEIATRANVALTDLGMVQGRGGLLAAWFTRPAPWTAASLTPQQQSRHWGRVARTASAVGIAFGIVWLVQMLVSFL